MWIRSSTMTNVLIYIYNVFGVGVGRGGGNKTNILKVKGHNELLYVCGSSHGTAAVSLPGFTINW